MAELLERITRVAENATSRISLKSVLNPCLWFIGVVTMPSLVIASRTSGSVQIVCLVVACIPVALFVAAFAFFAFKDPDKLRSEDYEIRKQALNLIQEKGGSIPISGASIQAIANPEYRLLPDNSGERS